MTRGAEPTFESFTLLCTRCARPLLARSTWVGRQVECPHCDNPMCVPPAPPDRRPVAGLPPPFGRRTFNFACPRCRTLLEAHGGLSGRSATCPTCAARLVVPRLDRETDRPEEAPLLDADDQHPTPMHAYAASGAQAPRIHRGPDGTQTIECPRCRHTNPVEADRCGQCGIPFTLEGASRAATAPTNAWAAAALILGLVSLPTYFLFVPAGLAVVCGIFALRIGSGEPASRVGVAGLILGLISLTAGAVARVF